MKRPSDRRDDLMKTVIDAGDGQERGIPTLAFVIINESGFVDEKKDKRIINFMLCVFILFIKNLLY